MRVYLKEFLDPRLTRLMTLSLIRRLFFLDFLDGHGDRSRVRGGQSIARAER